VSRFAILGSRGYPSYYSGFETLVRQLAPFLVASGHDVVVYGRASGVRRSTEIVDGVELCLTRGLEGKSTSTLSFGLTASFDLVRRGCDAALVLNVANGFYLPRLARAGIATCVNVDGLEWMRSKWGFVARQAFLRGARATARHADALVFDSRALGIAWQERFGRDGCFIPYGAPVLHDVGNSRLLEARLPLNGYVLVVARIVPENNVDLLLDALAHIPADPPVVVVGDSNYDHATVRRLKQLAGEERIHWLGHVADQGLLDELWANAGVYWHGHSVGGTNPALLQGLGAGAPTIALDTPFNREVIARDDQLVPNDPVVLGERIASVLESPTTSRLLSGWGQKVVAERYTWDGVCEQYQRLLEQLASGELVRRPSPGASSKRETDPGLNGSRSSRSFMGRGKVVAVVGPDGAGKSTLTAELRESIAARISSEVPVVNFRERHLDRVLHHRHSQAELTLAASNPGSTPSRGIVSACAKAFVLWADLLWSARCWRRRGAGRITLVERYAYDLVVDPRRLGLTRAPRSLRALALRLSLSPDLVVVCRAPAAVLRRRKPELDEAEISRQYREWDRLRSDLDGVAIIEVDTTAAVDTGALTARILKALRA